MNENNTRVINLTSTDLASRFSAATLRREIEELVDDGYQVIIDLSVVVSISESYADECFGVLAFDGGIHRFSTRKLVLRGATERVRRVIASAVKRRLTSGHTQDELSPMIKSLLAAKRTYGLESPQA